jgi:hypothetical protein
VFLSVQRLLPNFVGTECQRQMRGLIESRFVIAKDLRFGEALNDFRRFQHGKTEDCVVLRREQGKSGSPPPREAKMWLRLTKARVAGFRLDP